MNKETTFRKIREFMAGDVIAEVGEDGIRIYRDGYGEEASAVHLPLSELGNLIYFLKSSRGDEVVEDAMNGEFRKFVADNFPVTLSAMQQKAINRYIAEVHGWIGQVLRTECKDCRKRLLAPEQVHAMEEMMKTISLYVSPAEEDEEEK